MSANISTHDVSEVVSVEVGPICGRPRLSLTVISGEHAERTDLTLFIRDAGSALGIGAALVAAGRELISRQNQEALK